MGRLIFWLLFIAAIIWFVRAWKRKLSSTSSKTTISDDMVRCAHCGIHVPKSEGLLQADKYYCSTTHRDLAERDLH